MQLGSMVHKWAEDPDQFAISSGERPSDVMCAIIDMACEAHDSTMGMDMGILLRMANQVQFNDPKTGELKTGWSKHMKDDTRTAKLMKEGSDYWQFVLEAGDKVIVNASTRDKLEGMIASLENKEIADMIRHPDMLHEQAITHTNHEDQMYKGLIDMLLIDKDADKITIFDLKTTKDPITKFFGHIAYRVNNSGDPARLWNLGPYYTRNYIRQMAFYQYLTKKVFEVEDIVIKMIVVENTEPYGCAVYDAMDLALGMDDVRGRTAIIKEWTRKFQEDTVKEEVIE